MTEELNFYYHLFLVILIYIKKECQIHIISNENTTDGLGYVLSRKHKLQFEDLVQKEYSYSIEQHRQSP